MKVLRVVSEYVDVPLLEVRTDGKNIEVIVDNTNGKISKELDNTLGSLQAYVQHSSHLKIEEPSEPAAHLYRYLLENGDVAEVTTDGATCLLNGKLLSRPEKAAFFEALSSGKVKVARKADVQNPIPVTSGPRQQQEQQPIKLDRHLMALYRQQEEQEEARRERAALNGEAEIDGLYDVPSDDVPFAQRIAQTIARDKYNA